MGYNWRADQEVCEQIHDYFFCQDSEGGFPFGYEPKGFDPAWEAVKEFKELQEQLGQDEPVSNFPFEEIVFRGEMEELMVNAWWVNCLAKDQNYSWYKVKDLLLRVIVEEAAPQQATLCWGLLPDEDGSTVLYVDLPGYGQVSFHVFWEDSFKEIFPLYPFGWTGIPNKSLPYSPLSESLVNKNWQKILRGGENEDIGKIGEIHNQFVRAGLSPAPVWQYFHLKKGEL